MSSVLSMNFVILPNANSSETSEQQNISEHKNVEQQTIGDKQNITENATFNVYEFINHVSDKVKNDLPRVYVPNSLDNTVSVIDPKTYKVIDTFKTGRNPQHIVPSYDLTTLWILNDEASSVTAIDAKTGKVGRTLPVTRPYNLYFTMDGKYAIAINDSGKRFDFRDPETMELITSVPVTCKGLNHVDFAADGSYAIATCEYSSMLVKLDVIGKKILGYLTLDMPETERASKAHNTSSDKKHTHMGAMPQDVRISPDGKLFYIADMMANGVHIIEPEKFEKIGFIPTGIGTHSIYPSRDGGKYFFVANRGCNTPINCAPEGPASISVIDPSTNTMVHNWPLPNGGSPDMGNLNADGSELWLSGRYDREVYVIDTKTGELKHRIPVGWEPHGLTVWPQPGRFSLGHTGNMR